MPLRHSTEVGPAAPAALPAPRRIDDEAILDAARRLVLSHGIARTTLTDVAREAGLSRMTVYRRWSGLPELLGRMMQREWDRLLTLDAGPLVHRARDAANVRERLVDQVVHAARTLRESELLTSMRSRDPELLLPYLVERPGTMHRRAIDLIATGIQYGQADGSVGPGAPVQVATAVVLTAQSWVLSMNAAGRGQDPAHMDHELARLLHAYLRPAAPDVIAAPATAPHPGEAP